ncbi:MULTISPECIES: addiction module toxin RelE [unclassified Sporosarcina]|uniref:addiction module toxin RelE n=1 Tax=unclassified Sporosarcina TaxID=2647733 RepID=UPI00203E7EFC|nr:MULTISPECIES: addiction module toxin RelE [unclassified Sporosarcina]GKV65127.1 hypothetical protein NCCP2331_12800 [Sporosarcina sp. NCCP-2331]GLB55251.1 hypothetical protein NCCP2378_10370 [Sporosarcina sp. NCCP-2378]
MEKIFEVVFIEEAKQDYRKLDGSEKKYVDVALAKIKFRADELGEELTKMGNINLIGCKKIKFRKIGIRLVFRIMGDQVEIAEIISIGKRKNEEVYKNAAKRLENMK